MQSVFGKGGFGCFCTKTNHLLQLSTNLYGRRTVVTKLPIAVEAWLIDERQGAGNAVALLWLSVDHSAALLGNWYSVYVIIRILPPISLM